MWKRFGSGRDGSTRVGQQPEPNWRVSCRPRYVMRRPAPSTRAASPSGPSPSSARSMSSTGLAEERSDDGDARLIGKATGMEPPDRGQELRDTDQAVVATFVQARTPVCPRRFRPRPVSASSSLTASSMERLRLGVAGTELAAVEGEAQGVRVHRREQGRRLRRAVARVTGGVRELWDPGRLHLCGMDVVLRILAGRHGCPDPAHDRIPEAQDVGLPRDDVERGDHAASGSRSNRPSPRAELQWPQLARRFKGWPVPPFARSTTWSAVVATPVQPARRSWLRPPSRSITNRFARSNSASSSVGHALGSRARPDGGYSRTRHSGEMVPRASIRAPHGAAHRLSSYGAMSTV